ncbi:MAG TPA: lytic transglycosylase domain-containing protein [Verrucomicrobiota bacterium]|nr:lytic transglycosylase domain-containing protein [Verrucomicrobiota bacterium]
MRARRSRAKTRLHRGRTWALGGAAVGLILLLIASLTLWRRTSERLDHSQDAPILEAARRYNLDAALVKAVVWRESRFHPGVRGRAGEIGLMQLTDAAAQEWAETVRAYPLPEAHLYDPRTNALAGTWYLRKLIERYRKTDDPVPYALADYNAGRANVLKWAGEAAATNSVEFVSQIAFPSTRHYVESVIRRWRHYQQKTGFGLPTR